MEKERKVMKKIFVLWALLLMCVSPLLANEEEATEPKVTYLGVHVSPITGALTAQLNLDESVGLVVDFVDEGSPAGTAGLKQYDILLKLEDQILIGNKQFSALVKNRSKGDRIEIEYLRAGERRSLALELDERTGMATKTAKWVGDANFQMPGSHMFRIRELENVPHADPEAMAEWSKRLGKSVSIVMDNVYKGAHHPDFEKMPHVYLKRGNKMIQFSDEDASYDFSTDEQGHQLQIRKSDGISVFKGVIVSEEDLNSVPEAYRDHARLMFKMEKRLEEKTTEL